MDPDKMMPAFISQKPAIPGRIVDFDVNGSSYFGLGRSEMRRLLIEV